METRPAASGVGFLGLLYMIYRVYVESGNNALKAAFGVHLLLLILLFPLPLPSHTHTDTSTDDPGFRIRANHQSLNVPARTILLSAFLRRFLETNCASQD